MEISFLAKFSPMAEPKCVPFIISCAIIDENFLTFYSLLLWNTEINIYTEAKINKTVCIFHGT